MQPAGGPDRRRLDTVWRNVTPFGRTVLAGSLLAGAMGWAFGWEELLALAGAGLASVAIGVVMLRFGGSALEVGLDLVTRRVVVGDPARTSVSATNPTSRRTFPVRLEALVGRRVARVDVPSLEAGSAHVHDIDISTVRRAVVPVGPVRSVQGDPLGLVRRERLWTGTEHLFVHPRTVKLGSLATGWIRDLEGETTNDRSPSDVAFHTLREYVVGDDRRHIHWRTTARQPDGKLMVREFVDTRRAGLGLVMSLRAEDYARPDEFELAASVVGSLGVRSLLDEQEVVLVGGSHVLPSFHAPSFLDALAGVDPHPGEVDAGIAATRATSVLVRSSTVVVVTGSLADLTMVRRAADRLGPSVRTIIAVCAEGQSSMLRVVGRTPVLEVGQLEELPGLMWSVSNR